MLTVRRKGYEIESILTVIGVMALAAFFATLLIVILTGQAEEILADTPISEGSDGITGPDSDDDGSSGEPSSQQDSGQTDVGPRKALHPVEALAVTRLSRGTLSVSWNVAVNGL